MADLAESLARRFEVLRPHLSELQRRLWLGAEAAELGAGGVAVVALAAGVAPDTVRRGRAEAQGLDAASVVRSRRPGGGRKRAEVHDYDLVAALEALIDPVARGGPNVAVAVDEQVDSEPGAGVDQGRSPGLRLRGPAVAAGAGLQPAGQRQDHRGWPAPGPRRAVRIPQRPGPGAHGRVEPGDQRGHQEEVAT